MDLGAGTGRAVLRLARREPATLVVGVDADQLAMAHASQRGRAPANAVFLVESAERLPGPLEGRADLVTVALPWGSLLRAVLEPDPTVLARIAALLKPAGELELLLTDDPADLAAYATVGLNLLEMRAAVRDDVERLSSAWAKRLGIGPGKPAWVWRFGRIGRPQRRDF